MDNENIDVIMVSSSIRLAISCLSAYFIDRNVKMFHMHLTLSACYAKLKKAQGLFLNFTGLCKDLRTLACVVL